MHAASIESLEKMDKSLSSKMETFRKAISQSGEDIVFKSFPNKILELTELIESTKNTDSPFHISHTSNATDTTVYPAPSISPAPAGPQPKKRKLDNGPSGADKAPAPSDTKYASFPNHISANQHMVEKVHDIIKKESEELASLVDQVKLWVTLTLPKIEE
ncbi:hypothetical protein AGABI1DRAFT_110733, partial [Agaricus bisporus var. burnettii JB137-S8]